VAVTIREVVEKVKRCTGVTEGEGSGRKRSKWRARAK
jgi:hypothetical protein